MSLAREQGSALLATLCFAAVLSLSLSSYLAVCYRSLVLSNRGVQSTHGIELAEVGMEEALWALNNPGAFDGTWSYSTPLGVPTATKTITPGFLYENGATGQVQVTVSNYNKTITDFTPTVTPLISITAVGTVTLADASTTIQRTLTSDAKPAQLFTNAVGASGALAFTAAGLVDSYTTTDPLNPAAYAYGFSAVTAGATVDLFDASVHGFVATKSPATLQNQSLATVTGTVSGTGIDPSRVSMSANQPIMDTINQTATPSYDPVTHDAELTNSETLYAGSYQYDSIKLSDGAVLTITGIVVLKVTNAVQTSGTGQIVITNSGSLLLQIDEGGGQGLNLQGAGIINQTRVPRNLSVVLGGNYLGPTPTSVIDVSNDFYGSIYLPNDVISVGSNSTIFGALVARNITFTGAAPRIHFDPTLQQVGIAGIATPFALVQLHEK